MSLGRLFFAACAVLNAVIPGASLAQRITIDGSLAPAQTLVGPNYAITPDLGRQVGGNLFHSFGSFGLTKGESANFSGPANITNVIGRVTGGGASSIDGAINSSIAGANVYLINPAGMVFGPNATVNVSGSFHASTADYVRLSDGARFQATNPGGSTFSAAPPAAFGFLTASPPALTVDGAQLGPVTGSLSMVGGPIAVSNGASLSAPGGTIHLAAAASPGEVPVDPRSSGEFTVSKFASVAIGNGSKLDVSDPTGASGGGTIAIRAGALTISASELNADNYGTTGGGQITLSADSSISLSGSAVHSIAQADGSGANIALLTPAAGTIAIDQSLILLGNLAQGASGNLSVSTGGLNLTNRAVLATVADGAGTGGQIQIDAGQLAISALSSISASTTGPGSGGSIAINAGSMVLEGVIPNGSAFGRFDGDQPPLFTDLFTGVAALTSGAAPGGGIAINTGTLSMRNGAAIFTSSSVASGDDRSIPPSGLGSAGPIVIRTGDLNASSTSAIVTFAGAENAGNLTIVADRSIIIDRSTIGSPTIIGQPGNGGSTLIVGKDVWLRNGAFVTSGTFGLGSGGRLVIAASGNLDLSGNSVISTDSAGRGAAGSINLSARDITIGGGSAVLSRSLCFSATDCGQSDAGDIVISSANLRLSERAAISTTARIADGGNIVLQIGGSLEIVDGRITTSVKGGLGNGGNISIFPRHLLLLRSRISADAVQGRGGNVTIVADEFIPSADSAVTASSSLGISGSIEVVAPRVDLNGSLVALSSELRSAAEVLRHSCAQRNLLPRSSLAATGRGGLPQDPEVSVPAVYLADRDADPMPAASGQAPQPRTQVVSLGITMHCD